MYKFIITICLILLSGCEDYMEINGTSAKLIKLAKNKYNLECVGNGVAAPGFIKNFILHFDYFNCSNETSARKLLVDFTEDFILQLQNNEKVKVHLDNLPVNEKHVYFMIVFKDNKKNICSELSAIALSKGNVYYSVYDPQLNGFNDFFKETYSEAYFKVYGTQPPER